MTSQEGSAKSKQSGEAMQLAPYVSPFLRILTTIESYCWLYAVVATFQVGMASIQPLWPVRIPLWYCWHIPYPCLAFSPALFSGTTSAGTAVSRLDRSGKRFQVHAANVIFWGLVYCGLNLAYMVVQILNIFGADSDGSCGSPCTLTAVYVLTIVLAAILGLFNILSIICTIVLWTRESQPRRLHL